MLNYMKLKINTALLAAMSGFATSLVVQAEESQPVSVADFSITPMGNLGGDSVWDVHPKILVGTGYDSNLYGDENNEDSDAYFRGIAGITTRWNYSETLTVTGNGEYETKQFLDSKNDGADFNGGTFSLDAQQVGLLSTTSVYVTWNRADDPAPSTGETTATSTLSTGVNYRFEGLLTTYSLSISVRDINYLEDSRTFDAEERDKTDYTLSGAYGRSINEGEYWYIRGQVEASEYATNRSNQDSWTLGVTAGVTMLLGQRTSFVAEAGLKNRWYDEESSVGADDKSVLGPFAQLSVLYPWEEGSSVELIGRADVTDSSSVNAQVELGLDLNGRLRLRDRLSAFGGFGFTSLEDQGGGSQERRTTFKATLGLEYELRDGVAGRVFGRSTNSSADVDDDFDRYEAIAEVGVVF
jgi:hypothetical protein